MPFKDKLEALISELQDHTQLHTEFKFEASLGYMRLGLIKKKLRGLQYSISIRESHQ